MIAESYIQRLRSLDSIESVIEFLREDLHWVIPEGAVEDVTFGYSPQELGVSEDDAPRIKTISQLRPMVNLSWGVFILDFGSSALRRGILRAVLNAIAQKARTTYRTNQYPLEQILFICRSESTVWTFAHYSGDTPASARLSTFGWNAKDVSNIRTLLEYNLPALNMVGISEWSETRWAEAWNVEKVTKDFFKEYGDAFEKVEAIVTGVKGDKRLFVQRLFNRLLFIQFLSRKGWLRFEGSTDYLKALWNGRQAPEGFYYGHLLPLFFAGLNNEQGRNLNSRNPALQALIGEVPFLNGGLFEKAPDENQGEDVPDDALSLIINTLFARWNFTITESTPLDIDVAVDPEMLGKVFEELVTGRHETGSYYTPRPVVAFMCREALKGYLGRSDGVDGVDEVDDSDRCAKLVDEHDAAGIGVDEARGLIQKLESIKVCDPACGSGAYLLGMLQEIHALQRLLDTTAHQRTARDDHDRKLTIIENCLYGVDIDSFAVNIAWLRLWLALVIEDTRNPLDDPHEDVSLPNLDVKIGIGDSLLVPDPHSLLVTGQLSLVKPLIEEYRREKGAYMRAHTKEEKDRLRAEMAKSKAAISGFVKSEPPAGSFDWTVEFVEVFVDESGRVSGFDAVLANPPYVRADAQFKHLLPDKAAQQAAIAGWKSYRAKLVRSDIYGTLYEKWDLFIPFLERARQLLRVKGHMVYIISDAYNASKYTAKSHSYFLKNCTVDRLDFCSEIDLFDAGINNTIVHFSNRQAPQDHEPIRVRRWGKSRNDFEVNSQPLAAIPQLDAAVSLFRASSEASLAVADIYPTLGQICYLSVGMVIHADEKGSQGAFRTQELISPTRDAVHTRPIVQGREIARWNVRSWQYLEWGTPRAPGLFRRPTFPELYDVPEKIITINIGTTEIRAAYDDQRLLHNHSASSVVPWHALQGVRNRSIQLSSCYEDEAEVARRGVSCDRERREKLSKQFRVKYLLAVMNSATVIADMRRRRRSGLNIYAQDWRSVRIPFASAEDEAALVALVDQILSLRKANPDCDVSHVESEIDVRVDFLYFHQDEAPAYGEWVEKREAERGTAIEEIRGIVAAGESASVEFKQSLEFVEVTKGTEGTQGTDAQRAQRLAETRKAVLHIALKTICAFLNSRGGTLLLGVHDDGSVIGIEPDYTLLGRRRDRDGFENKLTDLLKTRVRPIPHNLEIRFVEVDSKTVCRIDAPAERTPHYLDNKLYIRLGNSTEELTGRDLEDWLIQRGAAV